MRFRVRMIESNGVSECNGPTVEFPKEIYELGTKEATRMMKANDSLGLFKHRKQAAHVKGKDIHYR